MLLVPLVRRFCNRDENYVCNMQDNQTHQRILIYKENKEWGFRTCRLPLYSDLRPSRTPQKVYTEGFVTPQPFTVVSQGFSHYSDGSSAR